MDGAPTVPVVCDACGTTTRVPLSEVADTVARHNDRLHDGTDEAGVDPALVEQIRDLAADDLVEEP
jgi:hypothetical protein